MITTGNSVIDLLILVIAILFLLVVAIKLLRML